MSKMQDLQQALRSSSGKGLPEPPAILSAQPPAVVVPVAGQRPPSRVGHINISSWLPKDFKSSLRLVQAHKGGSATLQELMAEAFNDLFAKYNVPTIQQGDEATR